MTVALSIKPQAQADIDERAASLNDEAFELAERFLAELHHVFDRLTAFPAFGPPFPTANHPDLRRVILPTLPLSVFYRPTRTGIEVLRVLHQAQDIPPLLDDL